MAFKLFLVSYAASGSSDNLHPTISGGNWIEVGHYQSEADAKKAAQNLSVTTHGALPGPNTNVLTLGIVVSA